MEDNNKTLHVYDGIEEQNNPMPDWWVGLFILTVIFAAIYWLHYTFGGGTTLKEAYHENVESFQLQVEKNAANAPEDTEESLAAFMKSENAMHEGQELYSAKCAMCHGEHLEGKIGPNLTDKFWTTGNGSRVAVLHTIKKGSAAKGMPAWETMLKPSEIKNVTAFIFSKIGSNPANAKAAEGDEAK